MKTILKYIRLYFLIGSQYAKSRMSYRADYFISIIGTVFWFFPSFFSIIVIFTNIPSMAGWSLDELIFIYGFYLLSMEPNGIFFGNAWSLSSQIRSGNFIKYYFRPLNMMFYFMTEGFDLIAHWGIPVGIGLIIWSSIKIGVVWNAVRIIVALSLLCSASLIFIGLMVAAASTAFWLTNSHSLLMLVSRFRENARYPLTIYNTAFKVIFSTILPIGFAVFYPAQWILRPDEAGIAPFFTPLVGVACFLVAYLIWHVGTRKWTGTGT
jgi:ABC-2 type transport system permease protein